VLLATPLPWMDFVRPTGAGPKACVTIYVLTCHHREFLAFAESGAAWFAAFVIYCWITFGRLIPEYYLNCYSDWSQMPIALAGILISLSRGLFIFVPTADVFLYLVARYWYDLPCTRPVVVALGIIAVQIVIVGSWHFWWGGYSYGPRLMTDAVPWFVLLGILGLTARSARSPVASHRLEAAIGLVLLAVSVVANGRGALSWTTFRWNGSVDIDFHPERAFD
jgi:hypothetical protein